MDSTTPQRTVGNGSAAIKDASKNAPVLLFGSFTEGETRTLITRPSMNTSSYPAKDIGIQFGSVNFLAGEYDGYPSSGKLNSPEKSTLAVKNETLPGESAVDDSLVHIPEAVIENGYADNCTVKKCEQDTREEIVNGPSLIHDDDTVLSQFSSLNTDHTNGENVKTDHVNGSGNLSTTQVSEVDGIRGSNGHFTSERKLLPRGLINPGNLCFLNASLQALMACSAFVELLFSYGDNHFSKVTYPTLSAFTHFIANFFIQNGSCIKMKDGADVGAPFCPMMFAPVIEKFTPDIQNSMSGRPRQEDAQEFLSFILNQLHDELLKHKGKVSDLKGGQSSLVCSSDDDEWVTVGRKNKSAVTRTQSFIPSELSTIFGGELRSVVTAAGSKASATIQPFLLLHLDIFPESIHTIDDALRLFSSTENLQGYRTSKSGKAGVGAKKCLKIQTPSKIMILHLMRFGYGKEGSTKLHKGVRYPLELTLSRNLFVSPSAEGRRYELIATITHHGKDPWKGHYTADARYPDNRWLRFDDSSVSVIGINRVLQDQAYVLFYRQV